MDITNFVVQHRENALLVGDYNTYRAQLSRKLHTTRKRLGQTTPKGKKYTAKPEVTAEDISKDNEFAYLLLLCAERAWATAMHMKSVHSSDPSTKGIVGSARRHIVSRLNKATSHAKQLVQACQNQDVSRASVTDILEARAYLASILGAFWMEKQRWDQCLQQYSTAKVIYTALGKQEKRDTIRDLLSGTIDPGIRYAAYQMKLPRSTVLDSVVIKYFPADESLRSQVTSIDPDCLTEKSATTKQTPEGTAQTVPQTITWRSRTVQLEDAAISQALAAAAAAETQLSTWLSEPRGQSASAKEKAANYDNAIIASQDAVDATKTAIDELAGEGVDQGDKRMQALHVTRTAVNYALVGWRVGRNRILCGPQDGLVEPEEEAGAQKSKSNKKGGKRGEESVSKRLARLREHVVLYDAILQSVDFIRELPGVAGDESFMKELAVKRSYYQSLRCLAVGRSHALLSNPKNALALFSRALDLASASLSVLGSAPEAPQGPPRLDIAANEATNLHARLQGLVWRYRGIAEIEKISELTSKQVTYLPPMIERLDEYPSQDVDLTNLVTYPPQIQPIPVKPLFLDVAWNYIDYPRGAKQTLPNGGETTAAVPEEPKKEAKRGWFGFGR